MPPIVGRVRISGTTENIKALCVNCNHCGFCVVHISFENTTASTAGSSANYHFSKTLTAKELCFL
jgi:hypothetical protein